MRKVVTIFAFVAALSGCGGEAQRRMDDCVKRGGVTVESYQSVTGVVIHGRKMVCVQPLK